MSGALYLASAMETHAMDMHSILPFSMTYSESTEDGVCVADRRE